MPLAPRHAGSCPTQVGASTSGVDAVGPSLSGRGPCLIRPGPAGWRSATPPPTRWPMVMVRSMKWGARRTHRRGRRPRPLPPLPRPLSCDCRRCSPTAGNFWPRVGRKLGHWSRRPSGCARTSWFRSSRITLVQVDGSDGVLADPRQLCHWGWVDGCVLHGGQRVVVGATRGQSGRKFAVHVALGQEQYGQPAALLEGQTRHEGSEGIFVRL
jgi:hypothetical protein